MAVHVVGILVRMGPSDQSGADRKNILYVIYNEDNEKMRVVGRQEEARQIVQNREGWTFKCVRKPKPMPDLSQLEEALF